MNILIIDDNREEAEHTSELIYKVFYKNELANRINVDISDSSANAIHMMDKKKYEMICSETKIREESGIALANEVERKSPTSNFIYITHYPEQNLAAWSTCASAFILKPVNEGKIKSAIRRLRNPIESGDKILVRCFGVFSVSYQGKEITFHRKKSMEMLAVLVDRQGNNTSKEWIRSCLWDEAENDEKKNAYLRQLASDIGRTFHEAGVDNILYTSKGGYAINTRLVDCDYFDYNKGMVKKYHPVYMMQYEWAHLS